MKNSFLKSFRPAVIGSAVGFGFVALAALHTGCSTTTDTVTPSGTNVVTVTKSLDPTAVAQIDTALSNIMAAAPGAIADAQAISALVHGTNK